LTWGLLGSVVIPNTGTVKTIGVGVYWDSGCTSQVTSIDWGTIDAGATENVVVYIRNEGTGPVTLSLSTENWSPSSASSYMDLTWDYSGAAIAVDGVEAQGPAAVAARRWRDGLFHAADLGRNPGGLQPGHPHLALEQGQHRQTSAGAVGVQHVDRVVHMAAHVHVPGDDMAWQHGNGRPSGHHELVRLAVGDLVKQRCVEEDVAGQQVQQVDAQQDAGRNTPPSKPVRDMRGNRGHLLL